MRKAALTYRRETRAAQAEGAKPRSGTIGRMRRHTPRYVELDPEAPADRLAQSRIVSNMIAPAIRADSRWFWHGPDA